MYKNNFKTASKWNEKCRKKCRQTSLIPQGANINSYSYDGMITDHHTVDRTWEKAV